MKVLQLKNDKKEIFVTLDLKNVKNISSLTIEEGLFSILAIQGIVKENNQIIASGNVIDFLPNNDLGNDLKKIWKFNQNYSFCTNVQEKILMENGLVFSLKDLDSIKKAVKILEENNLLIDRGISFGKRTLIKPLPEEIINISNKLLSA